MYISGQIKSSPISLQRLLPGCPSSGWLQSPSTSDASPQPVMSGCLVSARARTHKHKHTHTHTHSQGNRQVAPNKPFMAAIIWTDITTKMSSRVSKQPHWSWPKVEIQVMFWLWMMQTYIKDSSVPPRWGFESMLFQNNTICMMSLISRKNDREFVSN